MVIPFQNARLSNEIRIYKRLHAIDIQRKEIESVFIITKYRNIKIININRILIVKMEFITMINYNK